MPVIIVTVFCSCSSTDGPNIRRAKSNSVLPDYIPTVDAEQKQAVLTAKTAYISVNQTYLDASGNPLSFKISLPFEERAAEILSFAGIFKATSPSNADLLISIEVQGRNSAAGYLQEIERHNPFARPVSIAAGATLKGRVSTRSGMLKPIVQSFEGGEPPPDRLYSNDFGRSWFKEAFEMSDFTGCMIALLGQTFGVTPLAQAATNSNETVRRHTATTLGYLGGPEATRLLAKLLMGSDWEVRRAAAHALRISSDPDATLVLISALEHSHARTRATAAACLDARRDPRAVDALIKALEDKDSDVRLYARCALRSITGKDFGQDIDKWKQLRTQ